LQTKIKGAQYFCVANIFLKKNIFIEKKRKVWYDDIKAAPHVQNGAKKGGHCDVKSARRKKKR
jgi:hypothetical protein